MLIRKWRYGPAWIAKICRYITSDKPEIIFPPDGAEIAISTFGDKRAGVKFCGPFYTEFAHLNWFVDGEEINTSLSKALAKRFGDPILKDFMW